MDLIIYTYGYIDSVFYILNALAMFMASAFVSKLITAMAFIGFVFYGLKIAYTSSSANYKSYFIKIISITIIINVFLVPKTEMFIIDHVSKKKEKIDNIPYGFAIPVGLLELFGEALTAGFEQMFTLPGNINYRDYGMVFGSRLIQETRNWRIKTPEFSENMDNFIRRCVVRDAALGYKYSINTLLTSDDIWRLVSSNASRLRRVEIRLADGLESLSCFDAAKELSSHFKPEIDILRKIYRNTEFSQATIGQIFTPRGTENISDSFKKNIENIFNSYTGSHISAEVLLRQYMMVGALSDRVSEFGYARASMQQESNWGISGDLAKIYVPILLTVVKGIVYASFIFLVPMMLISGGVARYLGWISIVVSLQLWPAINAVLSMFIDLYSSFHIQGLADGVVSFSSYSKIGDYADKIVAVAAGLQISVPFLAFSLVQGGVSGFIHLAGNITGASSAAATSAAQEVVTGNKSFDNYNSNNLQMAIQSGFKTDFNTSYKEGASEHQNAKGGIEKVLPNSKVIGITGAGLTESVGSNKIMFNEEKANQLHHSYSENMSLAESEQASISRKKESLDNMLKQYAENISKHQSSGFSIAWEKLGSERDVVQNSVNQMRNLSKDFGYNKSQTTELGGSLSGDIGAGRFGIGGNLSVRGGFSATDSDNQSIAEQNISSKHQDWSRNREVLYQASRNSQFNDSAGISSELASNISHAYQQIEALDISRSNHLEEAKQIQKQLSDVQSQNISDNQDITSEVKKQLVEEYNFSSLEADDLINNPFDFSSSHRKIRSLAIEAVTDKYSKDYDRDHSIDRKDESLRMQNRYDQDSERMWDDLRDSNQEIIEIAKNKGLDEAIIKSELDNSKSTKQKQYREVLNSGSIHRASVFLENNEKLKSQQNEVDDREYKRKTSKLLGIKKEE